MSTEIIDKPAAIDSLWRASHRGLSEAKPDLPPDRTQALRQLLADLVL